MKGKHGALASKRRDAAEVTASIESYQHAVRRLTAENERLANELAESKRQHLADVRRLKANLDEGLSAETAALRRRVDQMRDERDRAKTACQDLQKRWDRTAARILDHFQGDHSMTSRDAIGQLVALAGESGEAVRVLDTPGKRRPTAADEAIARARGEIR